MPHGSGGKAVANVNSRNAVCFVLRQIESGKSVYEGFYESPGVLAETI
jgi:hypothetical protein